MMIHPMNKVIHIPESGKFSLVAPLTWAMKSGIQLQWNPRSTGWDSESSILNLEFIGVEPII